MIYVDNASTSFPKAPNVGDEMREYIENIGMNINRGLYKESSLVAEKVFETREQLCKLFNLVNKDGSLSVENVIFTSGATSSLNMVINGLLKANDHVIVSSFEHNSVMRPLKFLSNKDIEYTVIHGDVHGRSKVSGLKNLIRENTKLVIINHCSNITGMIFPVEEIMAVCEEFNIPLVLDAAQSAGHMSIDFKRLKLSALCLPGHKGLLGPQGIGALLLSKELASKLEPTIQGGTGSISHSLEMPEYMPDKFESGTLNLPGIYGLSKSLEYIEKNLLNIELHEKKLTDIFLKGIKDLPFRVVGDGKCKRLGLVSIDFPSKDNAEVAHFLESNHGILTRCGMHCSPIGHKTIGTYPQGTVRFSFGYKNTIEEVEKIVDILKSLV
ncbi:MAG: aminotransferase class V-fold PLP-dependent enzyme [Lachnospirales bacterium]